MSLPELAGLAVFAAALSLTPGPNAVMAMAVVANCGLRAVVPQLAGVVLGFTVVIFGVAAAYSQVLVWLPQVELYLKLVGAALLLWIAWRLGTAPVSQDGTSSARPIPFAVALLFQPANPKLWAMAVSSLALFVKPDEPQQTALIVAAVMSIVHIPCIACWALGGSVLRRLLTQPQRLRIFNAAIGLVLVAVVVWLLAL